MIKKKFVLMNRIMIVRRKMLLKKVKNHSNKKKIKIKKTVIAMKHLII